MTRWVQWLPFGCYSQSMRSWMEITCDSLLLPYSHNGRSFLQPKRRMKLKGKISFSAHKIQTPKLGTQILLDCAALRNSCQLCCKLRCPKRFHKSAVPLRAQSWVHLTSIGLAPSTTNITENSTVHTGHNRLILTYLGRTELVLSWTFGMLHMT
jgi:hypothetical protein